jgi:2-dehydro-3-deoxyphosphogluconate aldolase/(4S)-4-hydroxy-2-oxoglutarate aldolase
MAKFARLDVLNEIMRIGMVPVFYHSDFETAREVILACHAGGARVVEFTNRGDNAYRIFSDLAADLARSAPDVILGIGSVLDAGTAALYLSSGANFVVGSVFNPDVAKVCNRRKVAYIPGCGTPTEISTAEESGVEIVKLFPGSHGGPEFVRAVLAPTPWSRIMPTGGVEPTQESLNAWFKAGVCAVGMGSQLVRKEWVAERNFSAIQQTTADAIAMIKDIRGL